jgi:hypothetical protein
MVSYDRTKGGNAMDATSMIDEAYLSLAIPATDALRDLQQEICAAYQCTRRPELHVSLGYLGNCPRSAANIITTELSLLAPDALGVLEIYGVGGALRDAEGQSHLLELDGDLALTRPRVLWLAVLVTNELVAFRNAFIAATTTVDVDISYLRPIIWPHATLGSAGPDDGADWSRFDLQDVPKIASLKAVHITVNASALHITNTETAPDSITVIREFEHA